MHTEDLFTQKPFYFSTPSLKSLIQQLHHLAFFGDGISLVQGNKGSGKSKLTEALQEQFEDANEFCVVSIDSKHELGESIKLIASSLGLLKQDNLSVGELLSQLRHYSHSLLQDKKLCVVCIDNAHNLDEQSIGALLSLLQGKGEDNYGLHLILLATPGLEKRIDALQIIDVPVYDFSMPEFSLTELSDFLQLSTFENSDLDKVKIQQIWSITKGNPGKALELFSARDHRQKSSENEITTFEQSGNSDQTTHRQQKVAKMFSIPMGHMAAMALLGGILIWSIIYSRSDDSDEPSKTTTTIVLGNEILTPESQGNMGGAASTGGENPGVVTRESENLQIVERKTDTLASAEDGSSLVAANSSLEKKPVSPAIQIERPQLPVESSSKSGAAVKNLNINNGTAIESNPTEVQVSPVTANKAGDKTLVESKQLANQDEEFLLSQSPDKFTLQVLAVSKLPSLQAFIDRQANKDSLYMYRGTRDGKSWYVVVANVYSSRQAALDARASLPAEQAKAGPWPRPLSAIQKEINEYLNKQ